MDLRLKSPFFEQVRDGLKTVEGRCLDDKRSRMDVGELIIYHQVSNEFYTKKISRLTRYPTFRSLLEGEGLNNCLPDCKSLEDGVLLYEDLYRDKFDPERGVLAIVF